MHLNFKLFRIAKHMPDRTSLLGALLCLAFSAPDTYPDIPPPGTVEIDANKFIDRRLITYAGYNEFLFSIKRQDSVLYRQMLPEDTTVTFKKKKLWNNKKFLDHPVLGITEKQVAEYCRWRSEAVNFMIFNPEQRSCNFEYWMQFDRADPSKTRRVVYALPTRADIRKAPAAKEKYQLDELAADGTVPRQCSAKISDKTLKVFRCVAQYEPATR